MTDVFSALAAPFDPSLISWRVGSMTKDKTKARALAYLDARDVMRRLDAVVGPGNWQTRYPHAGAMTVCEVGIKVDGEWIWKANGAGHTDIEAEKGALSDAFKRAAVLWGIGQYLYDIDSPWVKIDEWKQIDKAELPRLRALLPGGAERKNSRQARSDGDWKRLHAGLMQCTTIDLVDQYLEANAEMIDEMPKGWVGKWTETVQEVRQAVRNRFAA